MGFKFEFLGFEVLKLIIVFSGLRDCDIEFWRYRGLRAFTVRSRKRTISWFWRPRSRAVLGDFILFNPGFSRFFGMRLGLFQGAF